jgi:predicted nucleic acid-binding protein
LPTKPSVYLETSIISYLSAHPSRDLITAARQQVTHEWWTLRRNDFDLYVSELVHSEASAGDRDAASRRIALLDDLPVIDITPLAEDLAGYIVSSVPLPDRAQADALHVALAAAQGIDYLMTWNVTHLANARIRFRLEAACRDKGYEPPTLCTPDELLSGEIDAT